MHRPYKLGGTHIIRYYTLEIRTQDFWQWNLYSFSKIIPPFSWLCYFNPSNINEINACIGDDPFISPYSQNSESVSAKSWLFTEVSEVKWEWGMSHMVPVSSWKVTVCVIWYLNIITSGKKL